MQVFVTGATGWVGSAVVAELLGAGHRVTGLARSEEKGAALAASGATVLRATLDDHDALRDAAARADAVIHTAFDHDFSRFVENAEQDRSVIGVLGGALEASGRPLLVTSGLSGLPRGATEADVPTPGIRKSEEAAQALAERGVRVAIVRLAPSVHGVGEMHGFVPMLIRLAREKGVSAYLDEGVNCWAGIHRLDAARVFRLALEGEVTERVYHAVADEAVPFTAIAASIGHGLDVPVASRPAEHFGWFARMAGPTWQRPAPGRALCSAGSRPDPACSPTWPSPATTVADRTITNGGQPMSLQSKTAVVTGGARGTGSCDIFVSNAALTPMTTLGTITSAVWRRVQPVNVEPIVHFAKAFAPRMGVPDGGASSPRIGRHAASADARPGLHLQQRCRARRGQGASQ